MKAGAPALTRPPNADKARRKAEPQVVIGRLVPARPDPFRTTERFDIHFSRRHVGNDHRLAVADHGNEVVRSISARPGDSILT
jgi:hypothetical protein